MKWNSVRYDHMWLKVYTMPSLLTGGILPCKSKNIINVACSVSWIKGLCEKENHVRRNNNTSIDMKILIPLNPAQRSTSTRTKVYGRFWLAVDMEPGKIEGSFFMHVKSGEVHSHIHLDLECFFICSDGFVEIRDKAPVSQYLQHFLRWHKHPHIRPQSLINAYKCSYSLHKSVYMKKSPLDWCHVRTSHFCSHCLEY